MPEPRKNVRLIVAYDGRAFFGWQRHPGKPTVQGALEQALSDVAGAPVEVRGAGRTDRGTHAHGQVASARVPADLDVSTLGDALAQRVPAGLTVLQADAVEKGFHARMSAIGKRYLYTIHNARTLPTEDDGKVWHVPGALDVPAMEAVLPVFVGELDFASFATKANHARKSTVRTVGHFSLCHEAPRIVFRIEADGFLYKMVRNIVRAVVKVGEGRFDAARLRAILAAKDRHAAPGTAPASGLCLDEVFYPPEGA